MVGSDRFERSTVRLETGCSILLSYEPERGWILAGLEYRLGRFQVDHLLPTDNSRRMRSGLRSACEPRVLPRRSIHPVQKEAALPLTRSLTHSPRLDRSADLAVTRSARGNTRSWS